MKTSQSFPFYHTDFIMGTMHLSAEEVGGYIRLLCFQWEQGGIPDSMRLISKISGVRESKLSPILEKFKKGDDGRLVNAKMERVRAEKVEYREKQIQNGKKGGRPVKIDSGSQLVDSEQNEKGLGFSGLTQLQTQEEAKKSPPSPSPSPSPNISPKPPKGLRVVEEKPKDSRHAEFIQIWTDLYTARHGERPVFANTRVFKQLQSFLDKAPDEIDGERFKNLIELAWEQADTNTYCTACKKSGTLEDLIQNYTAIRSELRAIRNRENVAALPTTNGSHYPSQRLNPNMCS